MVKVVLRFFKCHIPLALFMLSAMSMQAQQLIIMDRENGDKIVNDATITRYSSDLSTPMITAYFLIKNNTDKPLAIFLKRTINQIADSTTDFYCFYIKCWPDADSTDIADTIQPGGKDSTFASHVCHVRRTWAPPMVPGLTSITYTIYDKTTFPEPVEAKVTVLYHLSALGIIEPKQQELKVFPNPASTSVALELKEDFLPGECNITVFNSMGKIAIETKRTIENQRVTIPIHHLPNGIYSGFVTSGKALAKSFRFIVMH